MGVPQEYGGSDIRKAYGDAEDLTWDYFVNRCNEETW